MLCAFRYLGHSTVSSCIGGIEEPAIRCTAEEPQFGQFIEKGKS